MKTPEDEAFDELARKQGAWGGGYQAKRKAAADKMQEPWNEDEWRRNNWRCGHGWLRGEQCEICNAAQPAQEPWRDYFVNCNCCKKEKFIQRGNHHPWCACGSDDFDWGNERLAQPAQEPQAKQMNDRKRLEAIISVVCKYLPPDGTPIKEAMSEIISLVDPLPPPPAQETAQLAHIAQFMKELRPAIGPMATIGKSKTTQEWFDIVINEIERLQATQEKNT